MFKTIPHEVWAFDLEWVPDVGSGRRAYRLGPDASDADVLREMWRQAGADEQNPRPYLKTVLCRIVSIAAVVRRHPEHGQILRRLTAYGSRLTAYGSRLTVHCAVPSMRATSGGGVPASCHRIRVTGIKPADSRSSMNPFTVKRSPSCLRRSASRVSIWIFPVT